MTNQYRFLKVTRTTKTWPYDLSARLVYSALVYASRSDWTARTSRARLSVITGLSKATVAKAVEQLVPVGLVAQDVGGLVAREPTDDRLAWFRCIKKWSERKWQDRFAYTIYLRPSKRCPLTAKQLFVYCTTRHLADNSVCWTSVRHLAALLGMDRKTIRRILGVLEDAGLVMLLPAEGQGRDTLHLVHRWLEEHERWFLRIPDKGRERMTQGQIDAMPDLTKAKRFILEMQHVAGYSKPQRLQVAQYADGLLGLDRVYKLYKEAEAQNTHSGNSYRLLKWKCEQLVGRLKSRRRSWQ